MRISLFGLGLFTHLITNATATALTYKLQPNEKACFYSWVDQKGAKLAFYFAVSPTPVHSHFTYPLITIGACLFQEKFNTDFYM